MPTFILQVNSVVDVSENYIEDGVFLSEPMFSIDMVVQEPSGMIHGVVKHFSYTNWNNAVAQGYYMN